METFCEELVIRARKSNRNSFRRLWLFSCKMPNFNKTPKIPNFQETEDNFDFIYIPVPKTYIHENT